MPRYIDKDKLINKLKEDYATLVKERWFDDYVQGYSSAIDDVIAEPTADVQEVKHGHWIRCNDQGGVQCSKCRHATNEKILRWYRDNKNNICYQSSHPFYCSRCGAKMESIEGLEVLR